MSRSVVPPLLSVRLSLFLSVSLLCSFDSDGTNSLKVRVDICLYMYDFLCLFRDWLLLIWLEKEYMLKEF